MSRLVLVVVGLLALSASAIDDADVNPHDFTVYLPTAGRQVNEHFHVVPNPRTGRLLAFWTQESWEGSDDMHIMFARSEDGGRSWSSGRMLWGSPKPRSGKPNAIWQLPMVSRSGRVYCVWNQRECAGGGMGIGTMMAASSDDDGATWSTPVKLMDARLWCSWQRPMRLTKDGKFLTAVSIATESKAKTCFLRFENIDDNPDVRDVRFTILGENRELEGEEASIVKLPNGHLFAVMRSRFGVPLWTMSVDDGTTWSDPKAVVDDEGRVIRHPRAPCPLYDLDGDGAASGRYVALFTDAFNPSLGQWQGRGPLWRYEGAFNPNGGQPVRFAKRELLMPRDASTAYGNSCYSSYTFREGERVLWYPDNKRRLYGVLLDKSGRRALGAVENLALGKSYEFSRSPNYEHCKDADDARQLTDGLYAQRDAGTIWLDKATVGWWADGDLVVGIRVDLGKSENLSGFALDFAAGAAGAEWPKAINVYVSDDGKEWNLVGDLFARSKEERGAPKMNGYEVYCAESRRMPAKGRYVAFYANTRTFFFCDEVAIYAGPEPEGWNPVPIGDPDGHLMRSVLPDRLTTDLERLVMRGKSLPSGEKSRFDAEVGRLRERIRGLTDTKSTGKTLTVLPLHAVHRDVFALNRLFLRKAGMKTPRLWVNDRWANLDPLSVPTPQELADAPLEVEMMRGETRATAFNVANPTEGELDCSVEVKDLPETAHVDCREVVFTDVKAGESVSGALRPGEGRRVRFKIPSGVSKQVWVSFSRPSGRAGEFHGTIHVSLSDGTKLSRTLDYTLVDLDFPERPHLHVYGWDYTHGKADYYKAPGNLKSNLETMRGMFTDTPWARAEVLPRGANFDGDGSLVNADQLDFRMWDDWIDRWRDARNHAVFLQADEKGWNGEKLGTPRFDRMVGSYFRVLHDRYRKALGCSSTLLLMPVDEPGGSWLGDNSVVTNLIVTWARAIKASVPGIKIFEDPLYSNPMEGDSVFDVTDVICLPADAFCKVGNDSFRAYFLKRQKEGRELWLYSCYGSSRTLDPESYYRAHAWMNYQMGGRGMGFWAFGCGGGQGDSWHAYAQPGTEYSPYFVSPTGTMPAKQSEGIREGVEDFEYLKMLEAAIVSAAKRGVDVSRAQKMLESAPGQALAQRRKYERSYQIQWKDRKVSGLMDRARLDVLHELMFLQ